MFYVILKCKGGVFKTGDVFSEGEDKFRGQWPTTRLVLVGAPFVTL